MGAEALLCLIKPLVVIVTTLYQKVNCSRLYGVCIPKHSGKSYLVSMCLGDNIELLDLEANLNLHLTESEKETLKSFESSNSSYNLHYYPLARKYLEEVRKNFKHKNIMVFSSNYDLLVYCGVSKSNIKTYVPSNDLSNNIRNNLNDHDKKIFDSSRIELMLKGANKLISYHSFDDMNKDIIRKFKLSIKL
jgi:hypothetical protein